MTSDPTQRSLEQLLAVRPQLARIGPMGALHDALPARTLLHAGPPFADVADIPAPVANTIAAAAQLEGWAEGADALAALERGAFQLAPAQDHGVVTPLAMIVGPSTPALEVVGPATGAAIRAPLNDGPPSHGLRFGTGSPEGIAEIRALADGIAADLAANIGFPVPLLPLMAHGLANGDDLHSRLDASQAHLLAAVGPGISVATQEYLSRAGQFVLNVLMAGAALMLRAGARVPESRMVVAAGGNGREFGWKEAGGPDWIVRPALRPEGPRFPGREGTTPLPAIGDSAVLDALGFGAACMRFAPQVVDALAGHVAAAYASPEAHAPFLGIHPELPDSVRVGLDLSRPRTCLGIVLGMVEESGQVGLIGRGVSPWPDV